MVKVEGQGNDWLQAPREEIGLGTLRTPGPLGWWPGQSHLEVGANFLESLVVMKLCLQYGKSAGDRFSDDAGQYGSTCNVICLDVTWCDCEFELPMLTWDLMCSKDMQWDDLWFLSHVIDMFRSTIPRQECWSPIARLDYHRVFTTNIGVLSKFEALFHPTVYLVVHYSDGRFGGFPIK